MDNVEIALLTVTAVSSVGLVASIGYMVYILIKDGFPDSVPREPTEDETVACTAAITVCT